MIVTSYSPSAVVARPERVIRAGIQTPLTRRQHHRCLQTVGPQEPSKPKEVEARVLEGVLHYLVNLGVDPQRHHRGLDDPPIDPFAGLFPEGTARVELDPDHLAARHRLATDEVVIARLQSPLQEVEEVGDESGLGVAPVEPVTPSCLLAQPRPFVAASRLVVDVDAIDPDGTSHRGAVADVPLVLAHAPEPGEQGARWNVELERVGLAQDEVSPAGATVRHRAGQAPAP